MLGRKKTPFRPLIPYLYPNIWIICACNPNFWIFLPPQSKKSKNKSKLLDFPIDIRLTIHIIIRVCHLNQRHKMWKRIEVVITASTRNRVIQRWVRGFESHRFRQLSPHVLIQSMRTSFCIYRLINRQNTGYNYQIWAIDARNGLFFVILSDGSSRSPALFSLLTAAFRGRNQRFIMECTLRWTIAGYRPQ